MTERHRKKRNNHGHPLSSTYYQINLLNKVDESQSFRAIGDETESLRNVVKMYWFL